MPIHPLVYLWLESEHDYCDDRQGLGVYVTNPRRLPFKLFRACDVVRPPDFYTSTLSEAETRILTQFEETLRAYRIPQKRDAVGDFVDETRCIGKPHVYDCNVLPLSPPRFGYASWCAFGQAARVIRAAADVDVRLQMGPELMARRRACQLPMV